MIARDAGCRARTFGLLTKDNIVSVIDNQMCEFNVRSSSKYSLLLIILSKLLNRRVENQLKILTSHVIVIVAELVRGGRGTPWQSSYFLLTDSTYVVPRYSMKISLLSVDCRGEILLSHVTIDFRQSLTVFW